MAPGASSAFVSSARPAIVAGKRGLLREASGYGMRRVHVWPQGLYWANHIWFAWRERGVRYLASVHYFGPEETLTLLARLVRELRPV